MTFWAGEHDSMIREAAAQKFFEQYVSQFNIEWQCTGLAILVAIN
jgi:hypothetical protein